MEVNLPYPLMDLFRNKKLDITMSLSECERNFGNILSLSSTRHNLLFGKCVRNYLSEMFDKMNICATIEVIKEKITSFDFTLNT